MGRAIGDTSPIRDDSPGRQHEQTNAVLLVPSQKTRAKNCVNLKFSKPSLAACCLQMQLTKFKKTASETSLWASFY